MHKKGFTFIEVLVVITVFSIGVLAVLRMVLTNMSFLQTESTRTTATFLAKEGISLVYSVRDSNRLASLPWDCVKNTQYNSFLTEACADYFLSGSDNQVWKIGFSPDQKIFVAPQKASPSFDVLYAATALTLSSGVTSSGIVWYGYDSKGEKTQFARYVVLTGVVEGDKVLPKTMIAKVESHVLYVQGSYTGEVVLESFIGNY